MLRYIQTLILITSAANSSKPVTSNSQLSQSLHHKASLIPSDNTTSGNDNSGIGRASIVPGLTIQASTRLSDSDPNETAKCVDGTILSQSTSSLKAHPSQEKFELNQHDRSTGAGKSENESTVNADDTHTQINDNLSKKLEKSLKLDKSQDGRSTGAGKSENESTVNADDTQTKINDNLSDQLEKFLKLAKSQIELFIQILENRTQKIQNKANASATGKDQLRFNQSNKIRAKMNKLENALKYYLKVPDLLESGDYSNEPDVSDNANGQSKYDINHDDCSVFEWAILPVDTTEDIGLDMIIKIYKLKRRIENDVFELVEKINEEHMKNCNTEDSETIKKLENALDNSCDSTINLCEDLVKEFQNQVYADPDN